MTVPVVHEQVHQGTSQDEEIGQRAEDVRRVFGQQVEAEDGERDA